MAFQKYYHDIEYFSFDHGTLGLNENILLVDSVGCNTVTIVNTSQAGIIHVLPGLDLQVGMSVVFRGNEMEDNITKVMVRTDHHFFANIDYSFAVIKKKYYYDAKI